MDHIAIMKKGLGSIEDIVAGIKGIESRWMKRKIVPWDKVRDGDTIYFKYSGQPIIARARVRVVQQFELNDEVRRRVIEEYGGRGRINLRDKNPDSEFYRTKNYCVLVSLVEAVNVEPVEITLRAYGSAWFVLEKGIERVKKAA